MRLKSLELTGFKSFATKSELEFSSSISAIVGPNGSGKSNIAEAFRFVLGEQSMKSMRGKRGEDLIFNGSRSVPRGNRASVRATFDNKDRLLDIDFPEVTIERVVHRDSENEYKINNSSVRLKDIQELMASANIGSSGHHIISQGESDRILRVNPKERKQMIEDALGLQVYHAKKKASQRKLEKTNENLKDIRSLKREIQPHLNFLTKEIKKISKADDLREKLAEQYQAYFAREDARLKQERAFLNEKTQTPKRELATLEEKLADTVGKNEGQKTDENNELTQALDTVLTSIRDEEEGKQRLMQELGRREGERDSLKRITATQPATGGSVAREKVLAFVQKLNDIMSGGENTDIKLQALHRVLDSFKSSIEDKKPITTISNENKERLEELTKEMKEITTKVDEIEQKLKVLRVHKQEIEQALQKQKTSGLERENKRLHLEREIERLQSIVRSHDERERLYVQDEEEFKQMQGEAGIMCGREVLNYEISDAKEIARGVQLDKKREIERVKIRVEEMGVGSSQEIKKEYEDVKERDEFLGREIDDLEKSRDSLLSLIDDLEQTLEEKFREGVQKIAGEFSNYFSTLFDGGEAGLKLTKERESEDSRSPGAERASEEPSEGLEIDVQLPHKRVRGLQVLSGGERALTSIALLFAMSSINPPPFVILDETDAALDEANSRRYGNMIELLSERSQLILITHNRETMSRAGMLYGVTMGADGVSKLLSIKFEEAVRVAK